MRTTEEIHGLIEVMTVLGGHEKEIALARLILGDDKSVWQVKYEEFVAQADIRRAEAARVIFQRDVTINDLRDEVASLKERIVRGPQVVERQAP